MGSYNAFNRFKKKDSSSPSKYKNKKVIYNGLKFDSKSECEVYKNLKALEDKKLIKDLKCQVTFVLQPAYKKNGKLIRALTYKTDFTYLDINTKKLKVLDRKGFKTDTYEIKKKIFEYKYPELVIDEV